jgi:hypothetical protein
MRAVKRKVTDMTVDELKGIIHEAISEDMEVWRETFKIMSDNGELSAGTHLLKAAGFHSGCCAGARTTC